MSETVDGWGRCLCGAVEVHVKALPTRVGACHCAMCRTWSGGPLMVINCGDEVAFSGQDRIGVYASSAWAERGFCQTCGTHLFYRLKQTGAHFMPAGLFGAEAALDFDHQVFIEEKPAYYAFANRTKDLTGAEVFALFSDQG